MTLRQEEHRICDGCGETVHMDFCWHFDYLDNSTEVDVCLACAKDRFGPGTDRLLCRFVPPTHRPAQWCRYMVPSMRGKADIVHAYISGEGKA